MSDRLVLYELGCRAAHESIPLAVPESGAVAMVRNDEGHLILRPWSELVSTDRVIGVLHPIDGSPLERALIPWSPELLVDGVPPLGISVLRAGRTIGADDADFIVVREFCSETIPVPAEIAGTPCAACSAPLEGLVQFCSCGTAFHFEEGDGNQEPLCCLMALPSCTRCGEPSTLAPVLRPNPALLGLGVSGEGHAFDGNGLEVRL